MLRSFLEYIFESESKLKLPIFYTKRLRDFIYTIERSSKDTDVSRIANAIRFSENSNQMESDVTLIDMTDKNDMLSFIQVNRIKRKYDDLNTGRPNLTDSHKPLDLKSWVDYIWKYEPSNSLWSDQRGEVKVGKLTKKIFKDNNISVTDSSIEKFTNAYKASFDFEFNLDQKMELVSGEDIRKWYHESNYSDRKGQLASSCMRYEKCQKYLDIYVENPEVCSLLIMYSDQYKTKICGRALVWKTTDGGSIMDRVYSVNDYDIGVFRKYATSKEWLDISKSSKDKKVQLIEKVYDFYPYMDNFCFFNYYNFTLNTYCDFPSEGNYRLQNTDGSFTSDEGVWSEYHGEYIDPENAVYCPNANDYVYSDCAIYLEYKDIYASPDEQTVYSDWFDQSFYLDDTVHSEIMSDYILTNDSTTIFINSYGDEDYIATDFGKNSLITIKFDGEDIKTLSKFVILDPTTGEYHFRDEKIGEDKIQDVILDKLKDVVVDTDKIKNYLINTDFNLDRSKLSNAMLINRAWSNPTKELIKYLLYAYPNKSNQRDGLPILPQERGLQNHEKYLRFKNSISNFDTELLASLMGERGLDRYSNDNIFNLTSLSQSFIEDVFKDPEIYKMWYKWKNT